MEWSCNIYSYTCPTRRTRTRYIHVYYTMYVVYRQVCVFVCVNGNNCIWELTSHCTASVCKCIYLTWLVVYVYSSVVLSPYPLISPSPPLLPVYIPPHPLSPSLPLSHPLSPSLTLSHPLSPSLTLSHPLSPSLTLSHPLSPSLTLSHPLSRCVHVQLVLDICQLSTEDVCYSLSLHLLPATTPDMGRLHCCPCVCPDYILGRPVCSQ